MILPEFEKYLNQLMEENEKCQSAVKELMLVGKVLLYVEQIFSFFTFYIRVGVVFVPKR